MSLIEEVEVLKTVPLFASLDDTQLKLIAFTSQLKEFQPEQTIFNEGEVGHDAYILLSGDARVCIGSNGSQKTVATVKPYDFIGEVAILCDIPRIASIIANTEVKAMQITKEAFFQLMREFPEMAIQVMRELACRLNEAVKASQ